MYFLYLTSGAKYLAEIFQALGSSFFISKMKRRGEERRKREANDNNCIKASREIFH